MNEPSGAIEPIEVLAEGKYLALVKQGRWEYARRARSIRAVVIVGVTAADELLLVEQYRVPLGCATVELPAGLVGDEPGSEDETIELAAARELEEETGYRAEKITPLLAGPTSPGFCSEEYTLVLATELEKVGAGGGIDGEDIIVTAVALPDVPAWLDKQRAEGKKVAPKIYAGLWFAQQAQKDRAKT